MKEGDHLFSYRGDVLHCIIQNFNQKELDLRNPLFLSKGEIHLWQVCIAPFQSQERMFLTMLNGEEIAQAERFLFAKDRLRYIVAHGILRVLLSRYLNRMPHEICLTKGCYHKPELHTSMLDEKFSFNISHSQDMVVLAFGKYLNLGVDVEYVRDIPDFIEIVNQFFSQEEKRQLQVLPYLQQQQLFFDFWTCKEAFVKATGEGCNRSFDSFHITKKDKCFFVSGKNIQKDAWQIISYRCTPNYAVAVAFDSVDQ